MAAAALTVSRLEAFAPQTTRLRRSAGSTATRPPARRVCVAKAAGGDQVPGLWYVDEESQGEHPTKRFALFVILHENTPSYADLWCFPVASLDVSLILNRDVCVEMGQAGASRGRGGSDASPP